MTQTSYIVLLLVVMFLPMHRASANSVSVIYPQGKLAVNGYWFISSQEQLTAFDPKTRQQRWQLDDGQQLFEPVVDEATAYVAGTNSLVALDRNNGKIRWRMKTGSPLFAPVVDARYLYVTASDGVIFQLDKQTGEVLWKQRVSSGWVYPPALVGNLLITGGQEGVVKAIDRTDGDLQWQRSLNQELVYRPVTLGNGLVLVATFDGQLQALEVVTGRVLWKQRYPTPSINPILIGGYLITDSWGGVLRVLDPTSGELHWQRQLDSHLSAPASALDGALSVLTTEGSFYLFDLKNGERLGDVQSIPGALGARLLPDKRILMFVKNSNGSELTPIVINVGL